MHEPIKINRVLPPHELNARRARKNILAPLRDADHDAKSKSKPNSTSAVDPDHDHDTDPAGCKDC